MLQLGTAGWGRNSITRFVAWLKGMEVFTIKVTRAYSFEDFEEDLRTVMKMAGMAGQDVCFIFNEMTVLGPAMIERMNALLASGEVPGLFDGDHFTGNYPFSPFHFFTPSHTTHPHSHSFDE